MALDAPGIAASFDGTAGAYVHVPFCAQICPFCPYNKVLPRGDLPQRYFRSLAGEIARYAAAGMPGASGFDSVYVGGGTPTLYPEELGWILARLPTGGPRAVEVLPTHATAAGLDHLASAGVNAVSIGAQSLHDRVLAGLRRPHDAAASMAAIRNAVGRFDLVDVDLIVDAALADDPQLSGAFLSDLRTCMQLGVDQVSTYPLMRFGYTPFGRARHDRRREHELLARASELAASMGYERRSVWTFNRLGSPTYTSVTRRRFLGLGAGASSFAGRDFYVNHFGVHAYVRAVDEGRVPVARWLHLGPLGGVAYDAFWQAYGGRISLRRLSQAYGPWAEAVLPAMVALRAAGLTRRVDGELQLTARGFDAYHDLERWVTYRMIEPLWAQMLAEHEAEGDAAWARAERGRSGPVWAAVSRVMGRPVGTDL